MNCTLSSLSAPYCEVRFIIVPSMFGLGWMEYRCSLITAFSPAFSRHKSLFTESMRLPSFVIQTENNSWNLPLNRTVNLVLLMSFRGPLNELGHATRKEPFRIPGENLIQNETPLDL